MTPAKAGEIREYPTCGEAFPAFRFASCGLRFEHRRNMTKQLQGKIAIVTGASNGIGRGIAEAFAAEGARTVLVARRAPLLDEVAAGIKARGGEALAAAAALAREDAIVALFAAVQKTFGRLDILVNNAGIATHRETEDI